MGNKKPAIIGRGDIGRIVRFDGKDAEVRKVHDPWKGTVNLRFKDGSVRTSVLFGEWQFKKE